MIQAYNKYLSKILAYPRSHLSPYTNCSLDWHRETRETMPPHQLSSWSGKLAFSFTPSIPPHVLATSILGSLCPSL